MEMAEQALNDCNAPICSICIANYNGLDIIAECIESVLAQDCSFPIEIIVHDDASTDGSAELVRTRFPHVRLIESRENVGFCISNNRMAALARGEYLLLLNNDATLMPGALTTLRNNAVSIGKPAILSLPQYNAETGQLIDAGSFLDPFLNPIPNLNLAQENVGMVIGACFWIPATLWQKLGGFPEWFGSLAEDMHLCCAARLMGYPVRVAGSSGYRHHVGHSFGGGKLQDEKLTTRLSRRKLSERNKCFVMALCYPTPMLLAIFPIHLLLLLVEGLILSIVKQRAAIFHEIYLNCIHSLIKKRKFLTIQRTTLQQQRSSSLMDFVTPFRFYPHKGALFLKHGWPTIR